MIGLVSSFSVIDTHTAGHPTRVILSGIPKLEGASVLDKREDFRRRFDSLRGLLLHEPRGHAAMVGLVPVPSAVADYGAFFISSYVYLDMCGHGTIGFAKTLASTGQITREQGNSFTLETPAGVVTVGLVWAEDGRLTAVRIRNVPSYLGVEGFKIPFEPYGTISADIVYGGMWYALVDAKPLGLSLVPEQASHLMKLGSELKQAIKTAIAANPTFAGSVPPSVLFYTDTKPGEATHFLVLESNKFDRSPCGTGTAARVAMLDRTGKLKPDGSYTASNIFGVPFTASVVERQGNAVIVEIEGMAHLVAHSTILLEDTDPLRQGFLSK